MPKKSKKSSYKKVPDTPARVSAAGRLLGRWRGKYSSRRMRRGK